MPVASSVFVIDGHAQADGRRYVRETHTRTVGAAIVIEYLAAVGTNYATVMTGRVAGINERLADAELSSCIDAGVFATLEQTAAQLAARFRERWQASSREECARMAYWLIERINAGSFTDIQVRNAFGLTLQQYTTLKSNKLTPYHDAWAAMLAAVGE